MKSLAFLLLFVGTSLAAQHQLPWTYTIPALGPGDRVRVWAWEYGPQVYPHEILLGTRPVRVAGEVVFYHAPDSLRVRATGLLAPFSVVPERTIRWDRVARIDRPNGRDVIGGAGRGLGLAFGAALLVGLGERMFGCGHDIKVPCGSVWKRTARYSVVTVPVAATLGFFSTRWKRVY
jgi:hypothetical protein